MQKKNAVLPFFGGNCLFKIVNCVLFVRTPPALTLIKL